MNFDLELHLFPLVQLPKKFKEQALAYPRWGYWFPLVQLPKKFKAFHRAHGILLWVVSISSTSEEVQRLSG